MLQVGVLVVHGGIVLLFQGWLVYHDVFVAVAVRYLVLHGVDGIGLAGHV